MPPTAQELFNKMMKSPDVEDGDHPIQTGIPMKPSQSYPGLNPPEQILVDSNTARYTRLDDLIEKDIYIPENEYPDIFKDLGYVSRSHKEKNDFTDLELSTEPAIMLPVLGNDVICNIGHDLFMELTSGVSRQSVAVILILAFQLKKPGRLDMGRLFPDNIPADFSQVYDIDIDNVDNTRVVHAGSAMQFKESDLEHVNAQGFSFIAASMLRMFTRSPDNYMRAWKHICDGFSTFYSRVFPFTYFIPNLEVLKVIHKQFSVDSLLKSTLFRILYLSNESEDNDSLKKFLFDIHLSHTGMHILPITIKLCDILQCKAKLALIFLWNGEYDRQITSLLTLLSWIQASPPDKQRAMWRYGRIFSQNFMSTLQTKSCPKLVYILAAALKQEKPKEHVDILNISQLKEISSSDQKKCMAGGRYLVKLIRKSVNKNH